jgi:hypothetical protein
MKPEAVAARRKFLGEMALACGGAVLVGVLVGLMELGIVAIVASAGG